MADNVKKLTRELWELITGDDGKRVIELKCLKRREDRRGRVKRMLCRAIDESSLGHFSGCIYYFAGKVYEPVGKSEFMKAIYNIVANYIELPDADLSKLSDIYADCLNAVYSRQLMVSPNIMVFKNGVLDVDKNQFHRQFDKRFVQMWAVDYNYNPKAKTFLWYQFLNQVLPDKYLQDVLQMFLGATFIDRNKVKIENIMILLGKGANGKSVIQKAVCGVLGDEYVTTQEVGRLCARGLEGDMAVAEINGKRLNYCTEMEVTDFYRKSARLKAIVSGEKVPARRMYGTLFYATQLPLLMANANQVPVFNKNDDALLRRIYVIPFNVTIPAERQDKTLGDKLVEEYPAILNWILEGRDKFIKNGYRLPDDTNLTKMILGKESEFNSALRYMYLNDYKPSLEGVSIEPMTWMKLSRLHADYSRWCGMNGVTPLGKSAFTVALENEGGFQKKRFSDGQRFAVYGGVVLRELKRQKAQRLREMKEKEPKATTMWVEGKLYASSLKSLAIYCGVSYTTTMRLYREGKFHDFTKAWREKAMYEIQGCCGVMRDLFIIATDEEKDIERRIRKELKYMRNLFNQRMEYNGWPYRKYARDEEQIGDWCKVVPDEMSDDEVFELAVKDNLDTSKWERFGKGNGAFGRGGKGFFESVDEIPTEEEKERYNAIKSGEELV